MKIYLDAKNSIWLFWGVNEVQVGGGFNLLPNFLILRRVKLQIEDFNIGEHDPGC